MNSKIILFCFATLIISGNINAKIRVTYNIEKKHDESDGSSYKSVDFREFNDDFSFDSDNYGGLDKDGNAKALNFSLSQLLSEKISRIFDYMSIDGQGVAPTNGMIAFESNKEMNDFLKALKIVMNEESSLYTLTTVHNLNQKMNLYLKATKYRIIDENSGESYTLTEFTEKILKTNETSIESSNRENGKKVEAESNASSEYQGKSVQQ